MASGYALPTTKGSHHGYSHSYSGIHLSPDRSASKTFAHSNGSHVKKAVSNSSLYTHAETSRETSPIPSPNAHQNHHDPFAAFNQNIVGHQENGHLSHHTHNHSWSPMKSRPRGESDLGRPAELKSSAYKPVLESIPAASTSWFSLPEALTSLLVPLPCLLASASYSAMSGSTMQGFPPLSVYARLQEASLLDSTEANSATLNRSSGFIESCILTSSTLLLVGILAKMQSSERMLDRRKGPSATSLELTNLLNVSSLQLMAFRALSLALPFYASMQLGGMRTGLVLLISIAAGLMCGDGSRATSFQDIKDMWSSKVATSAAIVLSFITDEIGLTIQTSLTRVILGYIALIVSIFVLQSPLPTIAGTIVPRYDSKTTSPVSGSVSWSQFRSDGLTSSAASPLTCSVGDTNITLAAGVLLAIVTVFSSVLLPTPPSITAPAIILSTLTVASMASAILFSLPSALRSQSKAGLALGSLMTASCSFLYSPSLWPGTICNGGLSALSFLGVLYDTNGAASHRHSHDDHDHTHNVHKHHDHPAASEYSAFTKVIIAQCEPGSLIFSILSDKDSRRIAYFTA